MSTTLWSRRRLPITEPNYKSYPSCAAAHPVTHEHYAVPAFGRLWRAVRTGSLFAFVRTGLQTRPAFYFRNSPQGPSITPFGISVYPYLHPNQGFRLSRRLRPGLCSSTPAAPAYGFEGPGAYDRQPDAGRLLLAAIFFLDFPGVIDIHSNVCLSRGILNGSN
jgi:hypothetical protein